MEKPSHGEGGFSVYHDPREVVWKHLVARSYGAVLSRLEQASLFNDPSITNLRNKFITTFNSNYSLETLCERTTVLICGLFERLNELDQRPIADWMLEISQTTSDSIDLLIGVLEEDLGVAPYIEQSHVENGAIVIAGQSLETFASNPNYTAAILQLFAVGEEKIDDVNKSYNTGFDLTTDDLLIVKLAKEEGWDVTDLITQILINYQIGLRSPSLQAYEYDPNGTKSDNNDREEVVIREAFFVMGRVSGAIANYINPHTMSQSVISCNPLETFVANTGKKLTARQLTAVQRVALAHSSHGLNSGELTARLAGSVRASFPRALIASLNVRSGIVHAGAVSLCMEQTSQVLSHDRDIDKFARNLISDGKTIYGFGHRIHKIDHQDPRDILGKDPRVSLYINAAVEGFPEKKQILERLIQYARTIREEKPSLAANADFGATALFHCLELSPEEASGFLTIFRLPGLCAQIVNELKYKANSRRPPFAIVLPY